MHASMHSWRRANRLVWLFPGGATASLRKDGDAERPPEEASMAPVSMIELDIVMHVFQVHGADGYWPVIVRKKRRRRTQMLAFSRPSLPASSPWRHVEECITGAEGSVNWPHSAPDPARLREPMVKRHKSDAADGKVIARRRNAFSQSTLGEDFVQQFGRPWSLPFGSLSFD
jgi:hypothetical protein